MCRDKLDGGGDRTGEVEQVRGREACSSVIRFIISSFSSSTLMMSISTFMMDDNGVVMTKRSRGLESTNSTELRMMQS